MTDQNFDMTRFLAATREAFAPMLKSQQEGFKALERIARLQYAVAGDMLESSLARVNATLAATNPNELMSKHTELTSQFVDKLRTRAEEFATVTSEIQTKISQIGTEFAAKAVGPRKAA